MKLVARIARRLGVPFVDLKAVVRGNVSWGRSVYVAPGAELLATGPHERISRRDGCRVHQGVLMHYYGGQIRVGNHVGVNPYYVLFGHGGLHIGDHVMIATGCVLIPANHRSDRRDLPMQYQGLSCQGIRIEDDVWLGARLVVLDGVTIGRSTVTGAGAVVARDIPSGAIAVGVPARAVRRRPDLRLDAA